MRATIGLTFSAAIAMVAAQPTRAQDVAPRPGRPLSGSFICTFASGAISRGTEEAEASAVAASAGGRVLHVYRTAIRGFAVMLPDQAVSALTRNPKVEACEQDQIMEIIPIRAEARTTKGGATTNQPGQEIPWGIARVGFGSETQTFATAWVIDTGIDNSHPDLRVDGMRSRSFLGAGTTFVDQNGHGTHVAGTIAARDNSIGVIGVAPGATLVAVRVLDRSGSGTTSGVIAGIDYVASNARSGDVANLSLGGGASTMLDNAVTNAAAKGIRFAIAAGNSGAFAGNYSPARANGPNIYTVSAFGAGDTFASFSNFGNPPVDYAEPGVSIYSTWLGGTYKTISGTSMASPHLAGLLLLGTVANGGQVVGDKDAIPDVIGVANAR